MKTRDYPTRAQLRGAARRCNVEVFHRDARDARDCRKLGDVTARAGWHFWACFPGCLPESDACGPFPSELAALRAAYESAFIEVQP